jgi:hypothetical protein
VNDSKKRNHDRSLRTWKKWAQAGAIQFLIHDSDGAPRLIVVGFKTTWAATK